MTLQLIQEPSQEPITLAEARRWLRIDDDFTADDADITDLITAARVQAEHETGRSFLSTTWERVLDAFPCAELELTDQPVSSITHIKYLDTSGAEQTLSTAAYVLDDASPLAWVLPASGSSWPSTCDGINAVRVRFVQGWSSPTNPRVAPLRRWMRMQIEAAYKVRGALVTGVTVTDLPNRYVDRLLDPYRAYSL